MEEYSIRNEKNKVLIVTKDLNGKAFLEFEEIINTFLENGVENIIISFKDIRYITSTAISILLDTKKILEGRGGKVIIANLNEYVKWVLKTCGADTVLTLAENIVEAQSLL